MRAHMGSLNNESGKAVVWILIVLAVIGYLVYQVTALPSELISTL